jgi:transposase
MENETNKSRAGRAKARRQMVERYERSGKSQREFCEGEGISVSTLQLWLRKSRGGAEPEAMALREVAWPADSALRAEAVWSVELVSPRGWTLHHREGWNASELARLLKSLKC